MRIRIHVKSIGGSELIEITQIYLEVPDAGHDPITVTDTWTFVETNAMSSTKIAVDIWTFVESTDKTSTKIGIDVWTFVETDDIVQHFIQSGIDNWTFIETTNVVPAKTGIDTWTFVESTDKTSTKTGTDTWTFVESATADSFNELNHNRVKKLTIESDEVNSNLTDFPILVNITDSSLQASAFSDGLRIAFSNTQNTTQFSHEIEQYTSGSGWLTAWVKIPTISSSTDTDFYMWYGNNTVIPDQQDIVNTWRDEYKFVAHLDDDFLDSTSNNNDGTSTGTTNVAGNIADGEQGDGINDDIAFGNDSSVQAQKPMSVSAWVKRDATGEKDRFMQKRGTGGNSDWSIEINTADKLQFVFFGISSPSSTNTVGGGTDWQYLGVVVNSTHVNYYFNGTKDSDDTIGNPITGVGKLRSFVTANTNDQITAWHDMDLDELRFYAGELTADWVDFEYCNQVGNSTCASLFISPEESFGGEGHDPISISDVWTFIESTDKTSTKIGTDTWTFVESTDKTSTKTGTDTWTFIESINVVPAKTGIDTWTFVESTIVEGMFIRSETDTWTFVESTNVVSARSGTDTWTFVESTIVEGMFIRSGTDTWTFIETIGKTSTKNAIDTWTFVETTNVVTARNGTDIWAFVETTDKTSTKTGTDTWTFIESINVVPAKTGIDTWTFVESTIVEGMFIRSGIDTWTFIESTIVEGMFTRNGIDTWTFVESETSEGNFVRDGTDTWTFVETTDTIEMITVSDTWTFVESTDIERTFVRTGLDTWTFIEITDLITEFEPSGKYIWIICSFASNDTQGCIYASVCPIGQFVTGVDENGNLLCATP